MQSPNVSIPSINSEFTSEDNYQNTGTPEEEVLLDNPERAILEVDSSNKQHAEANSLLWAAKIRANGFSADYDTLKGAESFIKKKTEDQGVSIDIVEQMVARNLNKSYANGDHINAPEVHARYQQLLTAVRLTKSGFKIESITPKSLRQVDHAIIEDRMDPNTAVREAAAILGEAYANREAAKAKQKLIAEHEAQMREAEYKAARAEAKRTGQPVRIKSAEVPLPEGYVRLFRGVKAKAIETEFSAPLSPDENAELENLINASSTGVRSPEDNTRILYLMHRHMNREQKFYADDYEVAQNYSQDGVVYSIDIPAVEAVKYKSVNFKYESASAIPTEIADDRARVYSVGKNISDNAKIR